MRIAFMLSCVVIGMVSAYFAQPYMHHNADAILIIVTVLTVFAGFLIAIITILGDPIMIPDGSWRVAEGGRDRMEQRLYTHITLFVLYLVTIGFLFAGVILDKAIAEESALKLWIERFYLFLAVTSFLFTFALPASLMDLQRLRYDAETERRRRRDGIKPSEGDQGSKG
jgi:hypothetical protein